MIYDKGLIGWIIMLNEKKKYCVVLREGAHHAVHLADVKIGSTVFVYHIADMNVQNHHKTNSVQ